METSSGGHMTAGPMAQPADLVIEEVLRAWPQDAVKVRIQPQVYYPTPQGRRGGMFMAWRGLYWNLSLRTLQDAQYLRVVLTRTLALLAKVGPEEVLRRLALDTRNQAGVESAVDLNAHTNTV